MDFEARMERVRESLGVLNIDALLVTDSTNVRYLTGFSGSNGQVLISEKRSAFFTDPRYEARAGDLVSGADVHVYPTKLSDVLPDYLSLKRIERVGLESQSVSVAAHEDFTVALTGTMLVGTRGVVEELRRVKDDEELVLIREAVRIGEEALTWVLDQLRPGLTEKEIGLRLEVQMRRTGAEAVSFEPIVGSGPLSAHIHHSPSDRAFQQGDLILLDFGCKWQGYCSDLTRTVVLGPSTDEQRGWYQVVLQAQTAGTDSIRAGVRCADADAAARTVIDAAGLGQGFGHGLGHGVGLDIHEAPKLARTSKDVLKAGDVVTVEPGVYTVGSGGIRIEDCVLVTDEGAEVLGKAPKDSLIEL